MFRGSGRGGRVLRLVPVLRTTWLATLLFVGGSGGAWLLLGVQPSTAAVAAAPAIVVTPIIWWWVVERERRTSWGGAIAGGLIATLVWIIHFAVLHLTSLFVHSE